MRIRMSYCKHDMRRHFLIALVILAGLWTSGERLLACTCMMPGPSCQETWWVSAVFVGQVQDVQQIPRANDLLTRRVRFKVSERFRGELPAETVDIFTSEGGGLCGYSFETSRTYLVYARSTASNGGPDPILTTSICSRTRRIEDAGDDLPYLRTLSGKPPTAGILLGQALRQETDAAGGTRNIPFPGARVVFERADATPGRRYETTTATDGRFSVRAPVGKYRSTITVPVELYATGPTQIDVVDVRACAESLFFVRLDGRVKGRVVDAAGRPVRDLPIGLTRASAINSPFRSASNRVVTDTRGDFEFVHLDPNTYLLGVGLERVERSAPDLAIWLSNADGQPEQLTVDANQRVQQHHFRLPQSVELTPLSGVVLDAAGRSSAGAQVYLMQPGLGIAGGPVTTDASGAFKLTVIANRPYRLNAEKRVDAAGLARGESDVFVATSGTAAFTLRLNR